MEKALLDLLVCPVSKAPLIYDQEGERLLCKASLLAYPIRNGIPVLLANEASEITAKDLPS